MSDDLIKINHTLIMQVKVKKLIMEDLNNKLEIAVVGLKAIISEGSDNLNIAQKTLDEISSIELK